jgi:prevent-host-death family protein
MEVTISTLRQNIYQLLDKVLETGIPMEVKRKGKILRIMPPEKADKLKNLKKRDVINCDPEELVNIDWSSEWKY